MHIPPPKKKTRPTETLRDFLFIYQTQTEQQRAQTVAGSDNINILSAKADRLLTQEELFAINPIVPLIQQEEVKREQTNTEVAVRL